MMSFLKLLRFQNLLMLVLMQLVFRYGFLEQQNMPLALNDWQYLVLVLASVSIAAGGYLINNILNKKTDSSIQAHVVPLSQSISEAKAYNWYIALNIIGVGSGFYLANLIGKPGFALIFILISGTLYLYASGLKQSLLIGNIIIAVLTAFSVILIGIFDLMPMITPENQPAYGLLFKVLLDYALFAFVINFIRELVKDLETVNGDYRQGKNTIPILLGVTRTTRLVFGISFIPIAGLLYYINAYYFINNLYLATMYGLLLVVAPLVYFTVKMGTAKNQKDFCHLSLVLKLVLFFGILSALVVTLNIAYNA